MKKVYTSRFPKNILSVGTKNSGYFINVKKYLRC